MRDFLRRGVVLALVLALLLPADRTRAAEQEVYFTSINDQLMELRQDTMPFWQDDTFYVPGTIFEQSDCGITFTCNNILGLAILYRSDTDLRFALDGSADAVSKSGKTYRGKLIQKGEVYFLPLTAICRCFQLTWSFIEAEPAPILRIQDESSVLDDFRFADAAVNQMESRYAAYQKQLAEAAQMTETSTPVTPQENKEDKENKSLPVVAGQTLYLLVRCADANDLLPLLEPCDGIHLTVLLDTAQMADGELVRRILVAGHSVALYVEGEDPAAQLAEGRELLWQAACLWLEQVWYSGTEDITELLTQEGFVSMTARLSRSGLRTQQQVNSLLTAIGQHSSDLTVYVECCGTSRLWELIEIVADGGFQLRSWRMAD